MHNPRDDGKKPETGAHVNIAVDEEQGSETATTTIRDRDTVGREGWFKINMDFKLFKCWEPRIIFDFLFEFWIKHFSSEIGKNKISNFVRNESRPAFDGF